MEIPEESELQSSVLEIRQSSKNEFFSPGIIIAVSILVGSVLISSTIFYSTGLILQNLAQKQAVAAQQQAVAQQKPAEPAPDASAVSVVLRNDEPVLGNSKATVTIAEFGDFQCPFCQRFFNTTFQQIKSQYIDTGKVKLVFRHFPLTQIHANAQIASVAAECANRQGKFWEYHDLLYKNGQGDGTGLDLASLEKYGSQLGLNKVSAPPGDSDQFNQCLQTKATLQIVKADQAEGTKDGVTGTPTFFINGTKVVGALPFESFKQAIEDALK